MPSMSEKEWREVLRILTLEIYVRTLNKEWQTDSDSAIAYLSQQLEKAFTLGYQQKQALTTVDVCNAILRSAH